MAKALWAKWVQRHRSERRFRHTGWQRVLKFVALLGKFLENYGKLQELTNIWRGFANSLLIAIPYVILTGYFGDSYIARYLCEYRRRGCNVWALTIQNEPHAIQTWDSCLYTANEERRFLLEHLKGALEANGLSDVSVFFWDHNKERMVSRAMSFLDDETRDAVKGIAFHGYCGDHFGNIQWYRSANPGHQAVMSEFCMGYGDRDDHAKQLRVYGHEYINDVFYGADMVIDWNLVLDDKGGPNHAGNFCMAPFMTDSNFVPHSNMAFEVVKALSTAAGSDSRVLYHSSFCSDTDAVSFLRGDDPAFCSPYISCIEYVDRCFDWAQKYGLSVLLDVHTAPDSQNGYDNGGICAVCKWHQKPQNIERLIQVLSMLADRYGKRPNFVGLGILNEPASEETWQRNKRFYQAHDKERARGSSSVPIEVLFDFYTCAY